MKSLVTALSAASLLVVAAGACTPKADAQPSSQLPPPGLAGGPKSAAPLALPGAGMAVADPSGGTPSTQLPPGHPPIPGMDPSGAAGDDNTGAGGADHPGLPPGHPSSAGGGGMMGAADADAPVLTGAVLETMDVPEYTYMRVKPQTGDETWVAVTKTPVVVGDVVTVSSSLVMTDFFSKSLNRKFPKLVMGMMVGSPKKP